MMMGINPTKRELLQMAKDVDKDGEHIVHNMAFILT
jgi:Ca2+-binding EF-hand superfamily protein